MFDALTTHPAALEFATNLVALLPTAAYVCDARGFILTCNQQAIELWGWEPRVSSGEGLFCGALHRYTPDGARLSHADTPMAEALRIGAPQRDKELVIGRPNGSYSTVVVCSCPFTDERGRVLGALNILTDITDSRRAEKEHETLRAREAAARTEVEAAHVRYRELVDGLDAIVWEADAETWQFRFVSKRAETILGYPTEEWLTRPDFFISILHPDDRDSIVAQCRQACDECREHDLVYRAVAADGRTVWLRDIVYIAPATDGRPGHCRGVMIDVTHTKELEKASAQRAARLVEADRRKDEFLAMLAHELRNPLAAINTAATVLQQPDKDEESESWSKEVIGRQARHMSTLIDDLLDVSRVSLGKIELKQQWIDAAEVLHGAIDSVLPQINTRGHAMHVSLRDSLCLWADPVRLEQITAILLSNAAKYTDPGGRIRLSAFRREGQFFLRVEDDGIGIAPDQLEQLFELFAQGSCSLARSDGGLGIGLTLARMLTELHGGTIHARSEGPGKGSAFTVQLPIANPQSL